LWEAAPSRTSLKPIALLAQLRRSSEMNPSRSRLPRRHTQRQALRSARNAAPQCNLQSQGCFGAQERWARKNKLDSNWDINSVSDLERDSGYGSRSNHEAETEARYYDQMMDKFEEEGPTLSNPGDSTLDMMQGEKRNWKK
jgi:hypothetical protein